MDLNIEPQTQHEIKCRIRPMLQDAMGWKHIDRGVLEGKIPGWNHYSALVVYPHLLTYTGPESAKWVTEVWYKCRIECEYNGGRDVDCFERMAANFFKETVFPKIPIKPFKDEDAFRGNFSVVRFKNHSEMSFFLNPSYPEGRWCNHAIEDE